MSERPELPPARRRRTAATLCAYLGVEANEKRVKLISDVLLAGELDFVIACHRHGEITKKTTGYKGWWDVLIQSLHDKLDKLAYLKEAFCIQPAVSDAVLSEIENEGKPDVPLAAEND